MISFFTAPPHLDPNLREQSVEKGETLKLKIPYSGTGPFTFKLKKDNREVPDNDRVRIIPFDGYVILQIKGAISLKIVFKTSNIFVMNNPEDTLCVCLDCLCKKQKSKNIFHNLQNNMRHFQ